MGLLLKMMALGIAVVAGTAMYFKPTAQLPPQLQDVYWGPGDEPSQPDESVRPFKISFSKEMIDDLRQRLKNTRKLQPPLEDVGWTYGTSGEYVSTVVEHWLNKYDFKKREALLNRHPQFVTNVQGLDVHFIHAKPQPARGRKIETIPLLLLHGWPGSVVEFQKIIPMLTTVRSDEDFVFEVVAPSLPGFGYSDAAAKAGLGAVEMAHLLKNLMLRLGFEQFYVQGGDWGAILTANLASMYPQHVLGMHSNMCGSLSPWTWLRIAAYGLVPSLLPEDERQMMYPLSKVLSQWLEETGYLHEQATKPDTLGVGVSDSPAGLAAYILEKFSTATKYENKFRDDGNLLEKFTMDELLDNVMLYWAPNKATSSFRIYAETFNKHGFGYKMDSVPVTVASACAQFPNEIIFQSATFLRDRFANLVRVTRMPRGGHFAALEEPQLLADDIWASVGRKKKKKKKKKHKMLKAAAVFLLAVLAIGWHLRYQGSSEVPKLTDVYWGPGKPVTDPKDVKPFKIDVSKKVIDDLNDRLDKTRWPAEPLEGAAWTYGISSTYLKTVLKYWRHDYDWSKRQALLNRYPQFITKIQGLDVHFYHVKPTLPKERKVRVLPMLLLHGWPGSVVEFQKIIPMLTTVRSDEDFVFEVVVPSLPGYGFSTAAAKPGLGTPQMAVMFKNLMKRLGFERFYLQGGDWGAAIVSHISALFPESVIGTHSNLCIVNNFKAHLLTFVGAYVPSLVVDSEHYSKMYPLSHYMSRIVEESGYFHLQATKPDTVGAALTDSPAGLAAYILEKFSTWTNSDYRFREDGGLLEKFTLDDLIDNLMIYWITSSIATSQRLYAEDLVKPNRDLDLNAFPIDVPYGCSAFPHELMYQSETILRDRYRNLVQFTHPARGGHFAAFEEPELLADDVWSFVHKLEQQLAGKQRALDKERLEAAGKRT
ncbi:uncharacterized protein LOC106647206 [Copidosoma floridanum]|uniref:uncharacterized protein LOC106647206 n=1 Tax=Copidosoma floridanum TaxID=29053 RepID=UPI000C6F49B5|nr:uncharacterized protein LOC106647206 [Copidosoma floridanum]